eukprot:987138-Rhodomonas_salina.3
MTVAEALEGLTQVETAPVDTAVSERECVLCMALPRAVRLGCGHATYCRGCHGLSTALAMPHPLRVCPHCRRP